MKQSDNADKYKQQFFILLSVFVVLRLIYIKYCPLDLIPDEAYYWEWARRLDWSYYDKGPLIAYLIAIPTKIGGDNAFWVRFTAPFLLCLGSIMTYKLSAAMFKNQGAAVMSGLLLQIVPLFAVNGIIMTIDSPFIFFWCFSLWSFWKAIKEEKTFYWYITGGIIGLGFLSKYTMLFFFPSALLFLILSEKDKYWLRSLHPYLAFLMSLIVCSPVIIWNAFHGWVTVLHTGGHAHIHDGLRFSFKSFLDFAGSQIGVITPFLFCLVFYAVFKFKRSYPLLKRERLFLLCFSMPVFLFFILKSIQGKVQANWAILSYPALFVLFTFYIADKWRDFRQNIKLFIQISILLSFLMTFVIHFPFLLPINEKLDPSIRLMGWKELGEEVSRIYDDMKSEAPVFIFSTSYQISSEMAFYVKGNPFTYCINLGRRMNQYDLWPGIENSIGRNALFVRDEEQATLSPTIKEAFARYEIVPVTLITRQNKIMKFTIFKCYDFKGIKFKAPESF
jgi:4-amino-4-deoxy-L-arabinose transferase-like glycosyltransferase